MPPPTRLRQPVPAHRAARRCHRCRRRAAGRPWHEADVARQKAAELLAKLNLPEALLAAPPPPSPAASSGVNIARGFITDHTILLLGEPTASLDAKNRAVVVEMIAEKKQKGVGLLGIFHDEEVREAVAGRILDVQKFSPRRPIAA